MDHYYAMILAGGGGTRLWPMSRSDMPKQLLPLIEDSSMFAVSVNRLQELFPPERIYIVTGRKYVDAMRTDVPQIPEENFIIEPYGRDNAAAAGLGISIISKRDPQATIAILTADHHISKKDNFRNVLQAAYEIAQDDRIVTLGISPSYPSTGFGYIRQGDDLCEVGGFTCYEAIEFTEKPDLVKATAFLASGKYSWNSGMFIWKASKALDEFQRQQPEMFNLLADLTSAIDTDEFPDKLESIWDSMPKISIDFAIMEHARSMAVIPVDIGWSDVGSWASLFEVLSLDNFGNAFKGQAPDRIVVDTNNTLVISDRLTVTIGVNDIVVVDTGDVLMICHKDRTQEVRDIVKHLKEIQLDSYL